MDRADPMDVPFESIFKALPKDRFLERPESILSFMRDLGVDRSIVRMLDTIIQLDRRRFLMVMTCPEEDIEKQVRLISDDCLLREGDVSELIHSIRHALSGSHRHISIYLGNELSFTVHQDTTGKVAYGLPYSSAIYFGDKDILIGPCVSPMYVIHPDSTAYRFIDKLGTNTVYKIKGVEYTPTTLCSLLIKRLLQDQIDEHVSDIGHVTIICPSSSGQKAEIPALQAGIEAGLKDVVVLPEAIAAYASLSESCCTLVIHLDEDGFSSTLIDKGIIIDRTIHNQDLNTDKWGKRLMDLIIEKRPDVIVNDKVRSQLLFDLDILMRHIDKQSSIHHYLVYGSKDTVCTVTREEYMHDVSDLFDQIIESCIGLLIQADISYDGLGPIIVIGDFPLKIMMTSEFQKFFHNVDVKFLSYDSIALGATLYSRK